MSWRDLNTARANLTHMLQLAFSWEELICITTTKHSTYQEVKAYTCHLQLPEFDSWCETLWTLLHFLSHHYLTKQEHTRNWNAHMPEYCGQTACAANVHFHLITMECYLSYFSIYHPTALDVLLNVHTKSLWCPLLHPPLLHTCKALSNTWHQQVKYSGCCCE